MKKEFVFFVCILILLGCFRDQQESSSIKKIEIKKQRGKLVIHNPEQPLLGNRQFNFISRSITEKKFNYVKVDTDGHQNFYVLDLMDKKIYQFDKEGTHLKTINCSQMKNPSNLFIDTNNQLYVASSKNLYIFNNKGDYSRVIKFPYYIHNFAVTPSKKVIISSAYIKSSKKTWIVGVFDLKGKLHQILFKRSELDPSHTYGLSRLHPDLFLAHNKKIGVFGLSSEYKLYLINEEGNNSVIIIREAKSQPISKDEVKEMKKLDESTIIPKYKPFFNDLFIDEVGNIYVAKYEMKAITFDFFNKDGHFIYRIIAFPKSIFKILNHLLFFGEYENGSRYVRVVKATFSLEN